MTRRFYFIATILISFLFVNCNEDDNSVQLLSQSERDELDDGAIVDFLESTYFLENGTFGVIASDELDDDTQDRLIEYATKMPEGYWIVKKPNHPANGNRIESNEQDSILIQYSLMSYQSGRDINDEPTTGLIGEQASTINQTGYPQWDPLFYYATPEIERNLALNEYYSFDESAFEIPVLIDGLKEFKASNKEASDQPLVDFQGLIIVPSRLAYGRSVNQYGTSYGQFFDMSLILNFELYQVIDRE